MKKLLNILGTTAIIITTSFLVIACKASKQIDIKITNPTNKTQKNEEKIKNEIENTKDSKKEEKDQKNEIQSDQPKENEKYVFKKTNKENFDSIKKYGLKLVDSIFQKPEKYEKLNSNPSLSALIRKFTSLYSKIAKYKDVEEFESKSLPKSANEALYREFDEAVADYEKEKENIWKLLN
ncbi:lipoprotein [Mycoplasma capricolum]|uniref:lipoprotein n=1 Tax=Mycoplasma capricolum TaxID=2095 RepID=UPI000636EA76|nr:lipoprotein [Mycoplasma capricolum]KKW61574.1 Prolipoprotein [Mycoplasma capricolum subsp. capricolum]